MCALWTVPVHWYTELIFLFHSSGRLPDKTVIRIIFETLLQYCCNAVKCLVATCFTVQGFKTFLNSWTCETTLNYLRSISVPSFSLYLTSVPVSPAGLPHNASLVCLQTHIFHPIPQADPSFFAITSHRLNLPSNTDSTIRSCLCSSYTLTSLPVL